VLLGGSVGGKQMVGMFCRPQIISEHPPAVFTLDEAAAMRRVECAHLLPLDRFGTVADGGDIMTEFFAVVQKRLPGLQVFADLHKSAIVSGDGVVIFLEKKDAEAALASHRDRAHHHVVRMVADVAG
jgi:hypothetical protein